MRQRKSSGSEQRPGLSLSSLPHLPDSAWIVRRKVAGGGQASIHENTESWQLLHSRFLIRSPSSPSHNLPPPLTPALVLTSAAPAGMPTKAPPHAVQSFLTKVLVGVGSQASVSNSGHFLLKSKTPPKPLSPLSTVSVASSHRALCPVAHLFPRPCESFQPSSPAVHPTPEPGTFLRLPLCSPPPPM